MLRNSISWYIVAFSLLELISKTHLTVHDGSHGFINKNARYFEDDLSAIHEEISSFRNSIISDVPLKLQLRFEPSFLDFRQRALGIPHMEKVTLFNTNSNKTIDMTSISGSTVHFHSSFFEDKKIPPNGNTSFNVVFLGREVGYVESDIFIHTSEGFLKYNVKGASAFSQYRIRPLIGIKLPANTTFSPLIHMYNPFSEPLQIVEIYSSGGGFHLELPTGEQEGPNDMWEILPQHTKAVIRVRFQAKVVQNYTAYVRIKLGRPVSETLVVPVEVEVIPSETEATVHLPNGVLDLGVGGTGDSPAQVPLCVRNPTRSGVRVRSVEARSAAAHGRGLTVHYDTVRVPPNMVNDDTCVQIATVTVDWKTAYETKDFSGKIFITYRNGKNSSEIPYHLTVLKGGLQYDPSITTYFTDNQTVGYTERTFKVKNVYEHPLRIFNVLFPRDADVYFKIDTLIPKVLQPGEESELFKLQLKPTVNLTEMQLNASIVVKSNISDVSVPLLSYNGKVEIVLPFKASNRTLNMGLLSCVTTKEIHFLIYNPNPVAVSLKKVHTTTPMTSIEIQGCIKDDHGVALLQTSFLNITKCQHVNPGHYVVVKISVTTASVEGRVWGNIHVVTQFESLTIPMVFKVARGRLKVDTDRAVFDECFPGKICTYPIRIHSSFNDPMIIENITTLPPDRRVTSRHTGHIFARSSNIVGHLFLNPDTECQADCYTGLQKDNPVKWLRTFALPASASDFDIHLVNMLYARYLNVTSNGANKRHNIAVQLDTSEVKGHVFHTTVEMSWPRLFLCQYNGINRFVVNFPLTQVGNVTYQSVTVRNPASYNVIVQMVLDRDYPNYQTLTDSLSADLMPGSSHYIASPSFFFQNYTRDDQFDVFFEKMGVTISPASVSFLLSPGESQSVQIGFHSTDTHMHSALLFLRNNLTVLEVIRLTAQGAQPYLKFGNRKLGSTQPLTFDMTEKHLRDCEKQKSNTNTPPNLTVKRTFTARNVGDIPIFVNTFYINDFKCEGYGFRVIDCEPFILPPNGTKKIDIAFTPDLTLTRVTRTLILETSLHVPINYTLYTTIPSGYLDLCAQVIGRPYWEMYLSYIAANTMIVVLLFCICLAVIDADKIKKITIGPLITPNSQTIQPVLDLRMIGQQVREEIQSPKTEDKVTNEKKVVLDKASQKELEEDVKPKAEPARYTVLVPTVGKAKRKLGKRIIDGQECETNVESVEKAERKRDKHWGIKNRIKERKDEKDALKMEEKDNKHRHNDREDRKGSILSKKHIKVFYEEEASSTTTDSSNGSHCEDHEKENQRYSKMSLKSKLNKVSSIKSVSEDNFMDTKHVSFGVTTLIHNKSKQHKSLSKPNRSVEKQTDILPKLADHNHKHIRDGKKRDRIIKDRKEKNAHVKKSDRLKQTDRSKSNDIDETENYFNIPLPATVSSPVWGESKAKFSDVVARTETTTVSSINVLPSLSKPFSYNTKPTTNKPTVYVEPYKQIQSPAELGPIGSRRADQSNDTANSDEHIRVINSTFRNEQKGRITNEVIGQRHLIDNSGEIGNKRLGEIGNRPLSSDMLASINRTVGGAVIQRHRAMEDDDQRRMENERISNSYFSDDILLDTGNKDSGLEDLSAFGNSWNHQGYTGVLDSIDNNTSSIEDAWNQSLLESSPYWMSYSQLLKDSSLVNDNGLPTETTSFSQSSNTNESAGYLWGSSSVWQPWCPTETQGASNRTPPGFDEYQQQRNRDEQPHQESYNPFSSTNLWSRQQDTWNYSPGQ